MDDKTARELATRAAFRAGRFAMAHLTDPGYLKWRGRSDVIVGSAIEVQDAIVATIREQCPNDAILSEEGPEDEPIDVNAERLWIVDPICGSLNYAMGIPVFAVSIALRSQGSL
ncbi:MAG TPA: inositol monophosphatase family protein, partial [Candidatus Acidoferrales bacterium]|nr:inositol monophosphatase family protein [Candidatus Acidoferrales bacterium]